MKEAYIDLTICKCPTCSNFVVEPSWFVIDLKQDFECAVCKKRFNTFENRVTKFCLKFELNKEGKILRIKTEKSKY